MNRIKAAVAGLGAGWSHLAALAKNAQVAVVGICDPDDARRNRAGEEFGAKCLFADFQAMLRDAGPDFVVVATPDRFHCEQAVAALESGAHVLVEKPMAISTEECERMVSVVERTGRFVAVNQILRYNPRFQAAKRIIDSGLLGEPFFAEGDYIHNITPLITNGWRGDPVNHHHPLLGGGCHTIDLLRWFVGEVDEIAGYGSRKAIPTYAFDDCMVCALRFENGAVGRCGGVFGCQRPSIRNVQVYGTKGTYLSGVDQDVVYLSEDPHNRIELRQPVAGHPYEPHLDDLVGCILERRRPLVDVYEGANTVCVALAGAEAIAAGKPVRPRRFGRKNA